jgi:nitroimidazol reductase NimA-like FMN-containing flavoprotein (pyridoxamine 5'-phosphate oxidase superfamily)
MSLAPLSVERPWSPGIPESFIVVQRWAIPPRHTEVFTMSLAMNRAEREAFLAGTHVAIVSIAEEGRGPLSVPVWYRYAPGGEVRFATGEGSRKARLLKHSGERAFAYRRRRHPIFTSPSRVLRPSTRWTSNVTPARWRSATSAPRWAKRTSRQRTRMASAVSSSSASGPSGGGAPISASSDAAPDHRSCCASALRQQLSATPVSS